MCDIGHASFPPPPFESNTKVPSPNNCWGLQAVSIIYYVFVYLCLFIRHAMHMRHIILPPVAYPTVPQLSTYSHSRHVSA